MNATLTAPAPEITADLISDASATPVKIPERNRLATLLNRGYGINLDSATLMPLQLIGAIAGRSLIARSPDGFVCSAGFNLAMIGGGRAMVHGAQTALLDGILAEFQEVRDREADEGRDQVRHRFSSLTSRHGRLVKDRKEADGKLKRITTRPRTMEEAKSSGAYHRSTGQIDGERRALEAAISSFTKEIVAIEEEIADWKFASAPGLVRDGEPWEKFPEAGTDTFDGNFLQLGTAASLLEEYQALDPKWFQESVQLLRRSGNESPFSPTARSREGTTCSVQISGDPFAFSRLFHDSKFSKCGFFSGFLLVETEDENAMPDVGAMEQLIADENWRIILSRLLNDRLAGIQHRLRLDREGVKYCLEFRRWYLDFLSDIPEQHHWSLSGWPNLLVQIALGMAIIEDKAGGEFLDVSLLHRAGDLLKAHAPKQVGLLDTMLPGLVIDDLFEERLERLVRRLIAKGPLPKRELARTINGHDYAVIDRLIAEGKRRGLLFQRGELFYAIVVNVNGTAGNPVVDFKEGVAA